MKLGINYKLTIKYKIRLLKAQALKSYIVYTKRCGGSQISRNSITYKKCLLLEIITITKFLLFKMKYVIDGDCLFYYGHILLLYYSNT